MDICLMHDEGVVPSEAQAAVEAACMVLRAAGTPDAGVRNMGVFRADGWRSPEGKVQAFLSIDWYLGNAARFSRSGGLDATFLTNLLSMDPNRGESIGLILTSRDVYGGDLAFIYGTTLPKVGCAVSTARLKKPNQLKIVVAHELGHAFGLPGRPGSRDIYEHFGSHCSNSCVMRQMVSSPEITRVAEMTERCGLFCQPCQEVLREYFQR